MSKYIDISVPVSSDLPQWPGGKEFMVHNNHSLVTGDTFTDNSISMNLHTGTHVDAPAHFICGGDTVDKISPDVMLGPVFVVRIPDKIKEISAAVLSGMNIPVDTHRLLLHTANSILWERNEKKFYEDFTALVEDGAEWLVSRGIKLVGIDYLSIQRFRDGPEVHKVLLSAGVTVVEGLNMTDVEGGMYELYCMPIKLMNLEAAPARVILGYDNI